MPEPTVNHPPAELRIQLLGGFKLTAGVRQIGAAHFRLRKSRN
jgi:hypothetical protein